MQTLLQLFHNVQSFLLAINGSFHERFHQVTTKKNLNRSYAYIQVLIVNK